MESAFVSELVKQLQPAFYIVGAATVLFFVAFGGGLLKLIVDAKKDRENKIDVSLDGLKAAVIENTKAISKLEVKMEMIIDKYDKDLRNLGMKIRDIVN